MAALLLFTILVSLFLITYISNHRTEAPITLENPAACQSCSNHACSNYKGGES